VGAGFHMQALTKVSVWSTHAKTQRRWLAGPDRAKCWVSPLGTRNPWIARQVPAGTNHPKRVPQRNLPSGFHTSHRLLPLAATERRNVVLHSVTHVRSKTVREHYFTKPHCLSQRIYPSDENTPTTASEILGRRLSSCSHSN
jgi:hypothetical protein